jgi:hypothetical protein
MSKKRFEVAVSVVLGAVCVFLVLRLIGRVRAASVTPDPTPEVTRMPQPAVRAGVSAPRQAASASPDNAVLNVSLFRQLQAHALAAPDRDPFSFEPTPQQAQQALQRRTAAVIAQNRPPAPPSVPLKALGYSEDAQGRLRAYLSDTQNIYAVHEGESFGKVYRVLKITPTFVEVEDESLGLHAQLAIPQ